MILFSAVSRGRAALSWGRIAAAAAVAILFLMSPASAQSPGAVRRVEAPAWVDWIAPPKERPERLRALEDGRYDLLFDTQVRVDSGHSTTFRRRLMRIVDRAGLEGAAQTEITFDPASDDLLIHRIAIWRDGARIDLTKESEIDLLRREGALDDGIITGERTALVRLRDVRVGDIVDLAWSWDTRRTMWPGHYFEHVDLGWAVPVELTRFRVALPDRQPVVIRRVNGAPEPQVTKRNGMTVREWRSVDAEPIPDAARSPQWWEPWPHLLISTMPDWRAVADWATPLYAQDLALTPGFAAKVDAIAARSRDPSVRAMAALQLVQDSIRYTSLSIGEASFTPRRPAETIRNGFGDCKDKSQLLVAVLRRLGTAAWPALTDIDQGPGLDKVVASPAAFDHVIVLARIDGRDRWFDATGSHQGGTLGDLADLPYGFALPIRAGQDRLVAIPNPVPTHPTMAATETYRRSAAGVALEVVTVFTRDEADTKRAAFAQRGIAKIEREYLEFYRGMYPGLTRAEPLSVDDDRGRNRLSVRERYLLPNDAPAFGDTLAEFEVNASTLRDMYQHVGSAKRDAAIVLPYPVNRVHTIILETPGFSPPAPSSNRSVGQAFDLSFDVDRDGDRLTLSYVLKSKTPIIPGSAAGELRKQVEALDNATYWFLDLNSTMGGSLDGGNAALELLATVLLFAGWIGLVVAGVKRTTKRIAAAAEDAPYYPMPLWRFALLTIATIGLYAGYWFWNCWMWTRRFEEAGIRPLWRALFGVFWLWPLFETANARAIRQVAPWLGVLGAIGYLVVTIVQSVASRLSPAFGWADALIIPLTLCVFPALIAVDRANAGEAVRENARLDWLGWSTIVVGGLTWMAIANP